MSDETGLTSRNVDASKKILFVLTEILVFDFGLSMSGRSKIARSWHLSQSA
jgi:hypothetical protein